MKDKKLLHEDILLCGWSLTEGDNDVCVYSKTKDNGMTYSLSHDRAISEVSIAYEPGSGFLCLSPIQVFLGTIENKEELCMIMKMCNV